jgi:ERCC4-type nuclease
VNYFSKQLKVTPKQAIKRRHDENVLRNVISLRISDDELALLSGISQSSAKSISRIMREAFKAWQEQRQQLMSHQ